MLEHKKGLDIWIHNSYNSGVDLITHSALHHADEVVATVMLATLGEVNLYRTRDRSFVREHIGDEGLIVIDIGGVYDHTKRAYDHHQNDPKLLRNDGIKRAATGLIWQHYGDQIVCKLLGIDYDNPTEVEMQLAVSVYERLDNGFVRAIDAFDNGIEGVEGDYGLSQMLPLFNLDWDADAKDEETHSALDNRAFLDACFIADKIFRRLVGKTAAMVRGEKVIDELIRETEDRVLVLPAPIDNWVRAVLRSSAPNAGQILFAVYPARGGHWSVQALPPDEDHMFDQKLPFPEEWRGQPRGKLQLLTNIRGVENCHPGGFFAVCHTEEDAVNLANLAIEKAAASPTGEPADPDPTDPPYSGANPT